MKLSILTIGPFDCCFQYTTHNENLKDGTIVKVPFGNREVLGIVTSENIETDKTLKSVSEVLPYNIGEKYIDFLNWVSTYTLIPRGMVLKMILAEKTVFSVKKDAVWKSEEINQNSQEIILNEEQQKAFAAIEDNGKRPFLLKGVTGSGKTEVYLKKAKEIFQQGKQILILFPEIALTTQLHKRIEKYLGLSPIVWNSNITPKNRRIAWLRARSGEPCVIIGTRSALFIPFKNLGLIVIDEEHDSSYKQEEGGFYNARDMAIVLAKILDIPIILSSATPSLESFINAKNNKYGFHDIQNRYGVSKLPYIKLIDMRQNKFDGFISPPLFFAINERLQRHEQCLIYLNRRGYSPIMLCKSCGEKIACQNCSAWLVYHKNKDKLVCHYCGHMISIPSKCLSCSAENSYIPFGPGVERIYEELKVKFPSARITQASSDTFSSNKDMEKCLSEIAENKIDIIVSTQIMAKGHHFPNITLVGIVDGDLGLSGADLRSSEHTYQLINQVAGRAGRDSKPGEILIQAFNCEHSLFKALASGKSQEFIDFEIEDRKRNLLPPFSKFVSLIISGTNKELTEKVALKLRSTCPKKIKIFGPAPAPIFMLRGRVRWRILLKSLKKNELNSEIKSWIASIKCPNNIKIQIDVDPINFS